MTDLADRRNVLRWLKARAKGPVATLGGLSPGDRLTGAVKALEGAGSIVSSEARAELGKFLIERDAGEALVQYTSVDTVFILYYGQDGTEEDKQWLREKREAAMASNGGKLGTVDIRRLPSYGKLCKTTTLPTLERAVNMYLRMAEANHDWPRADI